MASQWKTRKIGVNNVMLLQDDVEWGVTQKQVNKFTGRLLCTREPIVYKGTQPDWTNSIMQLRNVDGVLTPTPHRKTMQCNQD